MKRQLCKIFGSALLILGLATGGYAAHGGGGHGGGHGGGGFRSSGGSMHAGGGRSGGFHASGVPSGGRGSSPHFSAPRYSGGVVRSGQFNRTGQFNSHGNYVSGGSRGINTGRGSFANSHFGSSQSIGRPNFANPGRSGSAYHAYGNGHHRQANFVSSHFGNNFSHSNGHGGNHARYSYNNYGNYGRNHAINYTSYFFGNNSPFAGYYGGRGYGGRGYHGVGYRGGYGGYGRYGYGGYGGYGRYGYGLGLFGLPFFGYGLGLGYGLGYYPGFGYGGYGYGYPYYGGYGYSSYGSYGYPNYSYSTYYAPSQTTVTAPVVDPAQVTALDPSAAPTAGDISAVDFAAQGEADFKAGKYEEAARDFRHVLVDDPMNAGALMLMGQAAFALGQYNEAAGATQMAMQMLPQDKWGEVITNRDKLYGNPQDYASQLAAIEKERTSKPNEPATRFLLGFHDYYLGKSTEALTELDKAIQLEPRDPLAAQLRNLAAAKLGVAPVTVPEVPKQPKARSF